MDEVATLQDDERAAIFQSTAEQINLPESAVEKDFWVCWALKKLFESPDLVELFVFKGGTTLSKCYGLIERFSEDIDLILDWTTLTDEDPYAERSNTQQDRFNKGMEQKAREFVADALLPKIGDLVDTICTVSIHPDRPKSILMRYPRAFDAAYIKPEIELEFGPMSIMQPSAPKTIRPYCAEAVPDVFENPAVDVRTISAVKSFWDKVTILHVEAHRPDDKPQPLRYSRHYYDLYQMLNSETKAEAMADVELLRETVRFKSKFYPQGWANYSAAAEGSFRLTPQQHTRNVLIQDYAQMREMIFGDYPDFEEILAVIEVFENELNTAYAA